MFNALKTKLFGSVNKLAGNTDFLEAVCAAAALIAVADGTISDEEIETTVKVVGSSVVLSKAFKQAEIERTVDGMLKRAQAGRTGRMGLYKEIEDIKANPDMCEVVYLCALDVAEANGVVEKQEKEVLDLIAKKLELNPANYNV